MNKQIAAWFKKVFPEKIISDETIFSNEEIYKIFLHLDENLNLENPLIKAHLDKFQKSVCYRFEYVRHLKTLTNPENKVGGSLRKKEYWLIRGWSEDFALKKVSDIQKKNSPRTLEYWVSRGFSNADALLKVKETQTENVKKMHAAAKRNGTAGLLSIWNKDFWIKRGLSESEADDKVREVQKENGLKSALAPVHVRRERSPWCLEYYLKRGLGKEEFEKAMGERFSYQSKIATNFFERLSLHFKDNLLYYGDKEFGKFIEGHGYVKYDYVDLTLKVVVEFDGLYWHSSDEAKRVDTIKQDFISSLGFSVLRVTDEDYKNNPSLPEKLALEIKELYEQKKSCEC